jgi:hypothetical protein
MLASAMKSVGVLLASAVGVAVASSGGLRGSNSSQRARLDVGFQDFQQNLTAFVGARVRSAAAGANWSLALQDKLVANVTESLSLSLKETMKPVKVGIGKTWMALPGDAQKDAYVSQLRDSFMPVFANSEKSVGTHLQLSLNRLKKWSGQNGAQANMLTSSEVDLNEALLTEHCHEFTLTAPKAKNGTAAQAPKKFCIQSVVSSLAHRLNDTEGLIGMSMRFEAGALALAQSEKAGAKIVKK